MFDLVEGEQSYHPNIDTNFNAAKEYLRKDYKENLDQAKEAGLLIEHWPGAMDNAGRSKRKAAF